MTLSCNYFNKDFQQVFRSSIGLVDILDVNIISLSFIDCLELDKQLYKLDSTQNSGWLLLHGERCFVYWKFTELQKMHLK